MLLNKTDIIRSSRNIGCLKYVQCFQDFNDVVKTCFSSKLDPTFESCIDKFHKSFLVLNISITPKVHAVIFHVTYFCKRHQRRLGYYSEQSRESVHADLKQTLREYNVKTDNKNFSENTLKAMQDYNSHHI